MLIVFSGVERVSEEPDKLRLFCCTEGLVNISPASIFQLLSIEHW